MSRESFVKMLEDMQRTQEFLYTKNPVLYSLQMYDKALDEGRTEAAIHWWNNGFLHFHYEAIQDRKMNDKLEILLQEVLPWR